VSESDDGTSDSTALPTPAHNLPILAVIQPAELRCNGATLSLARCDIERGHLLHLALTRPVTSLGTRGDDEFSERGPKFLNNVQ